MLNYVKLCLALQEKSDRHRNRDKDRDDKGHDKDRDRGDRDRRDKTKDRDERSKDRDERSKDRGDKSKDREGRSKDKDERSKDKEERSKDKGHRSKDKDEEQDDGEQVCDRWWSGKCLGIVYSGGKYLFHFSLCLKHPSSSASSSLSSLSPDCLQKLLFVSLSLSFFVACDHPVQVFQLSRETEQSWALLHSTSLLPRNHLPLSLSFS